MKTIKLKPPEFQVAAEWPNSRVDSDSKAKSVQALIANHTLIVGQSRSGKTNAARRIVEEILTWTDTRLVILDPNADFKALKELNENLGSSDKEFAAQWRTLRPRIGIASPDGASWGIDWGKLSLEEMAAFLRFNPTETFPEYRHLDRHVKFERGNHGLSTLKQFTESK